jgi:inhibitor of cysteine peptidase
MNTKHTLFWFFSTLIALLALVLAGCDAKSEDLQLTDADNGSAATVKAGQTIHLRLEANPTTGFGWEVSQVDAQLLALQGEKTYEEAKQNKQLVGGGGWESFSFTAQQTGETTLKLIYHRSWEEGVEPAETFEIKIRIE